MALIVNAEIIGFSAGLTEAFFKEVSFRFGIPAGQIILNASHNHSGPVIDGVLPLFHDFDPQGKAAMQRYTSDLLDHLLRCTTLAKTKAQPCTLSFHSGVAGFGVNRRRIAWHLRHQPDIIDHDVPILVARDEQGTVRGLLFGYACHTTVMFDNIVDGDYSGYAARALEAAFPQASALFLAGCGGDINPLPRRRLELSIMYGELLACAVQDAMESEGRTISAETVAGQRREVALPLEAPPNIEDLRQQLDESTLRQRVIESQFRPMPSEMNPAQIEDQIALSMQSVQRKLGYQLELLEAGQTPSHVPYAVGVLTLGRGGLTLVSLPGEPVVDYSLALKARYGALHCWPIGYCGHLVAYIPSRRVREEGGYEGRTAMQEYGLPSAFTPEVEALILQQVADLMTEIRSIPQAAQTAPLH